MFSYFYCICYCGFLTELAHCLCLYSVLTLTVVFNLCFVQQLLPYLVL